MSQPCQYFVYETVNRPRQPCNKYVQPCHNVVTRDSDKVVQLNFNFKKSNTLIDPMINNYSVTTHTHNMYTDSSSESLRQQHHQESCVQ